MRKCQGCGERFEKQPNHPPFQSWCSIDCGIVVARARQAKKYKAETKRRKESIKTKAEWTRETQREFNKFIRARDGNVCISCGITTGQFHAGHFLTTASRPELRFNEIGCHAQCAQCNNFKSGNITQYRINLIEKIGLPLVEWLEGPHESPKNWTIEELKVLKKYYAQRAREATNWSKNVL